LSNTTRPNKGPKNSGIAKVLIWLPFRKNAAIAALFALRIIVHDLQLSILQYQRLGPAHDLTLIHKMWVELWIVDKGEVPYH
jgi:hypothetical protein